MNDSECTCDIRRGGCTCGAMERERVFQKLVDAVGLFLESKGLINPSKQDVSVKECTVSLRPATAEEVQEVGEMLIAGRAADYAAERRGIAEPVKPADPRCWFCPAESVGAINGIYFCELHRIELRQEDRLHFVDHEPLPPDAILTAAAVNANVSPDVVQERVAEIDSPGKCSRCHSPSAQRRGFFLVCDACLEAELAGITVNTGSWTIGRSPDAIALFTKQQAAEMHAELVARIEALEAKEATAGQAHYHCKYMFVIKRDEIQYTFGADSLSELYALLQAKGFELNTAPKPSPTPPAP